MRSNPFKRNAIATALALTICAGNVLAATGSNGPEVFEQNGQMLFEPAFKAAGYQLRLVGPGDFRRELLFAGDEALSVSLKSLGQLADGRYKYEITAVNGFAKRSDTGSVDIATDFSGDSASSGSFSIIGGKLLLADSKLPEPDPVKGDQDEVSLAKDIVHADDVIVTNSLCVGFDCVNGESFGFDTIRLKENNTRIKFEDTSTGTFPSTDWQLTANDSASGGQNRFSIEDITAGRNPFTIEGGSTTNSIYVDSTGRVGFRTNTPVLDLHVNTSNTPGMRLEQNSAGGFSAQSWDIAGNETNFFIRDVTHSSKLPFRIRPGAPTSSIDIAASGNIGIGTASPTGKLHIFGSGSVLPRLVFQNQDTGNPVWNFDVSDNDDFRISVDGSGQQEFLMDNQGNITITGSITTGVGNSCAGGCDRVFSPDFSLEGIAEHAAQMWANGHLPGVGPTDESPAATINLTQKLAGMLNELEKAHIYIEQLNSRISELEARLDEK